MNRLKLLTLILGILNIAIGGISLLFVVMQNLLALAMGVLYIVFGISVLIGRSAKKLLFLGIIPFTVLFSLNIVMLGIDKDIPEYTKIPLPISLLIIFPLWILIIANIKTLRKNK